MQAETSPRLVTVAEAARIAHKHPATIRRWVQSGEVRGWRVNRSEIRVDLDEIETIIRPVPIAVAS